ncbi:ABC transporter permease subunit [Microlunatus flavus]|uniref:ABC-2 type transport system permease protein n=1 Tax=Microlunatus flavus TaxID=1036181 RepID=A0A1H9KJM0_9ACTN|nr:ABC transporter permease subunit [Microlunatus flavus]SEQ99344.1 ABC-2 type transport system permease protein [Microlunatus flavus]
MNDLVRLTAAELTRLRSRRVSIVAAVVVLAAVALFQVLIHSEVAPTAAAQASARQAYEAAQQTWQAQHTQSVAECVRQGGGTQEECESYDPAPTEADFQVTPPPFDQVGVAGVSTATYLSLFAAFLIGASFIGAEYATGSLANWLTFVPRRLEVFASKGVAVLLASALLGAVAVFATLGLTAAQVAGHGEPLVRAGHVAAAGGRAVVMVALAGVAGYVIALLTRHTVAAIAVPLGYGLVRTVVAGFTSDVDAPLAWLPPYLPELNLQAFLEHGVTYTQYRSTLADGSDYTEIEKHVSFGHSGLYWLTLAVVAVVAGALVFRRRDVT